MQRRKCNEERCNQENVTKEDATKKDTTKNNATKKDATKKKVMKKKDAMQRIFIAQKCNANIVEHTSIYICSSPGRHLII